MSELGHLRIGELSRRTGTSVDLLRAWEKRYGLLEPDRSEGGFRLYSDEDVGRVRAMQAHLAAGLAAPEAARRALENGRGPETDGVQLVAQSRRELADALAGFSEGRANAVLDRLLAALSVDAVLAEVVLPYLHELGEAWERGEASIAQEHFASNVLRGRLLGLGRGWGEGSGPHALLACPPREQHDLGLIAFGLALRNRGWRITYLGPGHPALDARAGSARAGARIASSSPPRTPSGSTTSLPTSRGWLGPRRSRSAARAPRPSWPSKAGASCSASDPVSAGGASDPGAPSRRSIAAMTTRPLRRRAGRSARSGRCPSSVTSSASPAAAAT